MNKTLEYLCMYTYNLITGSGTIMAINKSDIPVEFRGLATEKMLLNNGISIIIGESSYE